MTKLIQFHGHLKDLYPEGIRVEADSAYEAIAALQFFKHFQPEENELIPVMLPDFQSRDALHQLTEREIIDVHPYLGGAGGKTGTYLQIVIGVVLIATGWGQPAGTAVLGGAMTAGTAVMTGALMVLGGVTSLLMPQPKLDTGSKEENRSNYLSANKNTVKIGTRIPLIFGRRKWYGHFLSFNVTATAKGAPDPALANNVTDNTFTLVSGVQQSNADAATGPAFGGEPNYIIYEGGS